MHEPELAATPTLEVTPAAPQRAALARCPVLVASSEVPGAVSIAPIPSRARLILRGRAGQLSSAGAALGLTLPVDACQSASSDGASALWLGPTEWLILGADGQADALRSRIIGVLSTVPHALVDVSHRQFGFS